jgi:hypothetical protein
MVLAAQALDEALASSEVREDEQTTVFVASEHYRHPTVAALADRYAEAVWLTGGATLVLPESGGATFLIPGSLNPPAPWPEPIVNAWRTTTVAGPGGEPVLRVHHLPSAQVSALRDRYGGEPQADFAHVVWVHDAYPLTSCRVDASCPVLVIWQPRAPYASLQPVVRLLHPETGEWSRTMPFHYAAEQWGPGDLVLDQHVLQPPLGTPPGAGYQIGVSFYNPAQGEALPRLRDEAFAGLEVRFARPPSGVNLMPAAEVPTAHELSGACPGIAQDAPQRLGTLEVLGWSVEPRDDLLPGTAVRVRVCWRAAAAASSQITLALGDALALYGGEPTSGYPTADWRAGEVVEGRYALRLPRTLSAGAYALTLAGDAGETLDLVTLTVRDVVRAFDVPEMAHELRLGFNDASGELVRLVGYEILADEAQWTSSQGLAIQVTLVWQARRETTEDYVVFVHAWDAEEAHLLAQADEMPRGGSYPTSSWMRGEVVTDVHTVTVPADAGAGPYVIAVGLYLPETGEHLTADGARRVLLGDPVERPTVP